MQSNKATMSHFYFPGYSTKMHETSFIVRLFVYTQIRTHLFFLATYTNIMIIYSFIFHATDRHQHHY